MTAISQGNVRPFWWLYYIASFEINPQKSVYLAYLISIYILANSLVKLDKNWWMMGKKSKCFEDWYGYLSKLTVTGRWLVLQYHCFDELLEVRDKISDKTFLNNFLICPTIFWEISTFVFNIINLHSQYM